MVYSSYFGIVVILSAFCNFCMHDLRFSLGVTRIDRIRNEVIRGTTQTGRLGEKAREARLCLDTCRGGTVDTLVGEC